MHLKHFLGRSHHEVDNIDAHSVPHKTGSRESYSTLYEVLTTCRGRMVFGFLRKPGNLKTTVSDDCGAGVHRAW